MFYIDLHSSMCIMSVPIELKYVGSYASFDCIMGLVLPHLVALNGFGNIPIYGVSVGPDPVILPCVLIGSISVPLH